MLIIVIFEEFIVLEELFHAALDLQLVHIASVINLNDYIPTVILSVCIFDCSHCVVVNCF